MTNPELDKILKSAPEPELDADYAGDFPRQVFAALRTRREDFRRPVTNVFPGLAWGLAFAVCVLLAIPLCLRLEHKPGLAPGDVLADAKLIRETMAMFPNQLRAIVRDQSGIKLELADRADVPDSPPLLVNVCDGRSCASFVTFSGQEIQLGDKKFTVLAGDDGGIILAGDQFVWSNKTGGVGDKQIKISARALNI